MPTQALWMLLASLLFATMGVCVKYASEYFNSVELVAYRGVISCLVVAAIARWQGVSLKTSRPDMHAWRSFIGVISLSAWFYSLGKLPLATAMTLNYMSSVWVAAFLVGGAMLYDKSDQNGPLLLTVLAGFAGVVMVLRPAFDQNQLWAGLVGLLSGMTAALAYLQVTAMARAGEPEARTVFYFALGCVVVGFIAVPFVGMSPLRWNTVGWLIPIGVLASLGQLCMTRAYGSGPTLVAANLQYSGIVFAALYGVLLFGDRLPLMAWLGMVLVICSGIAATVLKSRAVQNTPAEEH